MNEYTKNLEDERPSQPSETILTASIVDHSQSTDEASRFSANAPKSKMPTFTSIQACRGMAALLVILVHIEGSIFANAKYFKTEFIPIFRMGDAGVQFFFVLSGFIILYIHWRDVGRIDSARSFVWKRFIRIYPIYWILTIVLGAVYFRHPDFGTGLELSPGSIYTSTTLGPYEDKPIIGVAWTLRHEVLFYALFLTLILNRTLGTVVIAVWFVSCVGWTFFGTDTFPGNFFFSYNNVLFLFGMACAYLFRQGESRGAGIFLPIGVIVFFGAGILSVYSSLIPSRAVNSLLYGAGSAFVIYGLVSIENAGRIRASHPLRFLGDASYSIYLVHLGVLSAATKVIMIFGLNTRAPHWVTFVILLICPIACGSLVHIFLEKPIMSALSLKRNRSQT